LFVKDEIEDRLEDGVRFIKMDVQTRNLVLRLLLLLSGGSSLSLLLTEESLDDLLLLKKESTNNALTNGGSREDTTVDAGDGALSLGKRLVLEGAESGDTIELLAGISALGDGCLLADVLEGELATGGTDLGNTVGLGVVRLTATISNTLNHLYEKIAS